MRLWHYRLFPYLPDLQFRGQLRELVAERRISMIYGETYVRNIEIRIRLLEAQLKQAQAERDAVTKRMIELEQENAELRKGAK